MAASNIGRGGGGGGFQGGGTPPPPPVYGRSNTSLGQVRPLLPGAGAGSSSTQHPPAPGRTLGLDGHGDGVLAGPTGGVARHRDGVDHPLERAAHLQAPRVVRVPDGLHLGGVPAEHVAGLDPERHGLGDDVIPDRHLEQPGRPHLPVLVRGAGRPPDLELQRGDPEGLELPADDFPGPRDRVLGDEVHPGAGVPRGPAVRGVADGHQCAWKKARAQSGPGALGARQMVTRGCGVRRGGGTHTFGSQTQGCIGRGRAPPPLSPGCPAHTQPLSA